MIHRLNEIWNKYDTVRGIKTLGEYNGIKFQNVYHHEAQVLELESSSQKRRILLIEDIKTIPKLVSASAAPEEINTPDLVFHADDLQSNDHSKSNSLDAFIKKWMPAKRRKLNDGSAYQSVADPAKLECSPVRSVSADPVQDVTLTQINSMDLDDEAEWVNETTRKQYHVWMVTCEMIEESEDENEMKDQDFVFREKARVYVCGAPLRIIWELKEENKEGLLTPNGAIAITKYYDTNGQHFIKCVELPPVQQFASNPNKICQKISESLQEQVGLVASFTLKMTKVNKGPNLPAIYIEKFILKSYRNVEGFVLKVKRFGCANVSGKSFFVFADGQVMNTSDGCITIPVDAGIFIDRSLKDLAPAIKNAFPCLVPNQKKQPLSERDRDFLIKYLGSDNVFLLIRDCAMNAICVQGKLHVFINFGGTKPFSVLYGSAKGGKSTLLAIMQALFGIEELGSNATVVSKLKLSDFTVEGLEKHNDNIRGTVIYLEDADRGGNKSDCGGVYKLLWKSCDFADSVTLSRGYTSSSSSSPFLTANRLHASLVNPQDQGSKSRVSLLIHQPSPLIKKMTESQKQRVLKGVAQITQRVAQRQVEILTTQINEKELKHASQAIDCLFVRLKSEYPNLIKFVDSRQMQQLIPIMAYGRVIAKLFRIDTAEFMDMLYSNLVRSLQFDEEASTYKDDDKFYLLIKKYKGAENKKRIIENLLYIFKCLNTELSEESESPASCPRRDELSEELVRDLSTGEDLPQSITNNAGFQMDTQKELERLEEQRMAILSKHLFIIRTRTEDIGGVKNDVKLICRNFQSDRNGTHLLNALKWFQDLIVLSECMALQDLPHLKLKTFQYFIDGLGDWESILKITKSCGLFFTLGDGYKNTVRFSVAGVVYRFNAFRVKDKQNIAIWDDLNKQYGAIPKKKKKNNNKNDGASFEYKDNENENENDTVAPNKENDAVNHNLNHPNPAIPTCNYALCDEQMRTIINTLITLQEAEPFRTSVETQLSQDQYSDYVLMYRPMCMETLMSNVSEQKYDEPVEFATDVRRIMMNAMSYNDEKSEIYGKALKVSKIAEDLLIPFCFKFKGFKRSK